MMNLKLFFIIPVLILSISIVVYSIPIPYIESESLPTGEINQEKSLTKNTLVQDKPIQKIKPLPAPIIEEVSTPTKPKLIITTPDQPEKKYRAEYIMDKTWKGISDFVPSLRSGHNVDGFEAKAIYEYSAGGMNYVLEGCDEMYLHYSIWYAGGKSARHGLWSEYKQVTDFLTEKMMEKGCDVKLYPEIKEKLEIQDKEIQEKVNELLKEMEKIYAEN